MNKVAIDAKDVVIKLMLEARRRVAEEDSRVECEKQVVFAMGHQEKLQLYNCGYVVISIKFSM